MSRINEKILSNLHLGFILFTYLWVIFTPFYLGVLLIILHKSHEMAIGDCYLSKLQKDLGYSKRDEDFFYYLLKKRYKINVSKEFTKNIHLFIKTTVLIIVLIKMYLFFL